MTVPKKPSLNYAISAINLISGGPLTVLNGVLAALCAHKCAEVRLYLFTSRGSVVEEQLRQDPALQVIEKPWACRNMLTRLFFEYVYLYFWSRSQEIHLWLSLNDVSPNVVARHRVAYFHNPSPFVRMREMLVKHPRFVLYGLFYNLVYAINIKKNDLVVVQQNWIARAVARRYGPRRILTALPVANSVQEPPPDHQPGGGAKMSFCFPAFPRFFKNYQAIGEAVQLLIGRGYTDFSVTFTLKGDENKYSRKIHKKYGHLAQIQFVGLLSRSEMHRLYSRTQILIFPSLLETWGLPITEFKAYGKPMLVAERPYARETVGCYPSVCFFNPFDSQELAGLMAKAIDNELVYPGSNANEMYDCPDYGSLADQILAL